MRLRAFAEFEVTAELTALTQDFNNVAKDIDQIKPTTKSHKFAKRMEVSYLSAVS